MKGCLFVILILSGAPLFAQSDRFQGYVMNAAAFWKIQSFCVDTHNLAPDQVTIINRFVWRESQAKGLLTKLPWHRRATCQDAGIDAMVRLEFPHDLPFALLNRDDIAGVLLVFRPGSPSPIYETPAVTVPGPDVATFERRIAARLLEYNAAWYALRILLHDWQQRCRTARNTAC